MDINDKRRGNDAEEDALVAGGWVPVMSLDAAAQLRALVPYKTSDHLGRRWHLHRAADRQGRVTWVKEAVLATMRGCLMNGLDNVATMAAIARTNRDPDLAAVITTVWRLGGEREVARYLRELGEATGEQA